jgi:aryl-alcohol dehydrogenase-like predicted oxidoreductase
MKFALGTVQFGLPYGIANTTGRMSDETAAEVLRAARSFGWSTLDTAIAYGESENTLGRLGVSDWRVISKLPPVPHVCPDVEEWVRTMALESLEKLNLNRMYGLMLHQPMQLLAPWGRQIYKTLRQLQSEGWVEKIGISVYGPSELAQIWPQYGFDLIQAPFSIMDRRLVDSGWSHRLKDEGVEIHVRSIFLQGLLLLPADKRPAKFRQWLEIWNVWDAWLSLTGLTPVQACVRYAESIQDIDLAIVGVDSLEHLNQIVNASKGSLESSPSFQPLQDERLINPSTWHQL